MGEEVEEKASYDQQNESAARKIWIVGKANRGLGGDKKRDSIGVCSCRPLEPQVQDRSETFPRGCCGGKIEEALLDEKVRTPGGSPVPPYQCRSRDNAYGRQETKLAVDPGKFWSKTTRLLFGKSWIL